MRIRSTVYSIVLPLLASAVVLVAVRSMATTLAGGGPLPNGSALNADCFVYAEVAGNHPVKNLKFLQCADGDPTCDQDATCNGTRLHRACLLRPEGCGSVRLHSPPLLDSVHLNHRCPLPAPTSLQGSACGAFVTFSVPRATRTRPGRRRCTARAKAATSVSGRVDHDVYVFRCLPCVSSPSAAILALKR
jgi:hypothetical protein